MYNIEEIRYPGKAGDKTPTSPFTREIAYTSAPNARTPGKTTGIRNPSYWARTRNNVVSSTRDKRNGTFLSCRNRKRRPKEMARKAASGETTIKTI